MLQFSVSLYLEFDEKFIEKCFYVSKLSVYTISRVMLLFHQYWQMYIHRLIDEITENNWERKKERKKKIYCRMCLQDFYMKLNLICSQ